MFADLDIGLNPSELDQEVAFRIFPIAHQYGFKVILNWCKKAAEKAKLDLWPSQPMASSDVPKHSGLVQWLALADEKQCDALVESCLSQLTASGDSNAIPVIREVLASPHLRPLMEGLRPGTMIKAMSQLVGLPSSFQVATTAAVPSGTDRLESLHVTRPCPHSRSDP